MEKVIFLSPHFDDVVFSCAGLMQRLVQNNREIHIVTVFSEGSQESESQYKLRQAEDLKACRILNVFYKQLKFTDAPFRRKNNSVLFQEVESDFETYDKLIKAFQLLKENNPQAQFFAPLGVGWHIDHLLVCEAAIEVFDQQYLFFYEDAPYKSVKNQTELRIAEASPQAVVQYCESFLNAEYVKTFLADWSYDDIQNHVLSSRAPRLNKPLSFVQQIKLNAQEKEISQKAKRCYQSQNPFIESLIDEDCEGYYALVATAGIV